VMSIWDVLVELGSEITTPMSNKHQQWQLRLQVNCGGK